MAIVTGVLPTVISPVEYQDRFCQAMSTFFASSYPSIPIRLTKTSPWTAPVLISPLAVESESPDPRKIEQLDEPMFGELQLCDRILNEALRLNKELLRW